MLRNANNVGDALPDGDDSCGFESGNGYGDGRWGRRGGGVCPEVLGPNEDVAGYTYIKYQDPLV